MAKPNDNTKQQRRLHFDQMLLARLHEPSKDGKSQAFLLRELVNAVLDEALVPRLRDEPKRDIAALKYLVDRVAGPIQQNIKLSNDPEAPFQTLLIASEELLLRLRGQKLEDEAKTVLTVPAELPEEILNAKDLK